jgi:integrase
MQNLSGFLVPIISVLWVTLRDLAKIPGILERIPDSGVWWIRWTDAQGKRHLEKAGRRGDAIDLLSKRKHEKLLKKKLPEKIRGKLTFKDISDDALKHSKEENGEDSTYELGLKLAIIGQDFDRRQAEAITKKDIQDWLLDQTDEREWSPATRNRYQAAFSLVFRVAVDNEKLSLNPAARIKRKPEHNDRIRFMSADEEKRFVTYIKERFPHYLPAFMFSIHTGCRLSEQLGLLWSDINLKQRIVTFSKTKPGKTRHVPLNAIALAAVKASQSDSDHVFLNTEDGALGSIRHWFEDSVSATKLKAYTWHCNRHTFASRLVMAGVDIRTVAYLMGHSTIQMTMRYAHLAPEHNREAVEQLSKAVVTKSATVPNETKKRRPQKAS